VIRHIVIAATLAGCAHGQGAPAAAPGAVATTFRARGNEPGWSLTLDDNTMTLVTDHGSASRVMPTPPVQSTAAGRRYATESDGKDVVVTISDRPCADNMSGMPFPANVVVQLDGRELSGCGGEPVSLLTGNEWVVEDIDGKWIIDNSRASLNFGDDGRVYGRASCNTYSATFTLTGEGLTVANAVTTDKACATSLMQQEARFLETLQRVQRFEIGPTGELILHGPEGPGIVARR
jgi:heat shock protein HslJ